MEILYRHTKDFGLGSRCRRLVCANFAFVAKGCTQHPVGIMCGTRNVRARDALSGPCQSVRRATHLGLLIACLFPNLALADLSVDQTHQMITIATDTYSVTFDKTQGGTIVKLNGRDVRHTDGIDEYFLAQDPEPTITLTESAKQVALIFKASYVRAGQKSSSQVHAEYRYDFHAQSRAVRLRAVVRQFQVPMYADVYGYPGWRDLRILALGNITGYRNRFGGDRLETTLFFLPGTEEPFDVPKNVVDKLASLIKPTLPKGKPLFAEDFQDNASWTDIYGRWIVEDGRLAENSSDGRWAWTVAGERDWRDYIVESDVLSNNGCHAYLCARWLDVDNHYELHYLEWPAQAMRINRVVNGQRLTLAEVRDIPDLRVKPFTRLALAVQGNRIRAYRNDDLVLEAHDGALSHGRVALGAVSNQTVWFHNVDVFQADPAETQHPVVRITEPVQRHGFYRDENDATLRFTVSSNQTVEDLIVTCLLTSDRYPTHGDLMRTETKLSTLRANELREVEFTFDPGAWRSGDYVLTVTATESGRDLKTVKTEIFLRRRPNPDRMLVGAWEGPTDGDPKALAAYGFNQFKIYHEGTRSRWTSDGKFRTPDDPLRIFAPSAAAKRQHIIDRFDEALKHGMWAFMHLSYINRVPEGVTEAYALKRNGQGFQDRRTDHYGENVPRPNPWHPKTVETIQDFFRRSLPAWKDMPAWRSVLLNSESERELNVYGNDYWLDMAEKELGFKVPEDVSHAWGLKGNSLPDDGVIASDDPHYRFYRWWHERGEGQGMLHAKVAQTVHEVRPDVIVWHDPALRQPYVRGRLAGLDQIRHWNYAWPNVPRFPLITDELRLAAAEGQETVFMFQLIWFSDIPVPRSGPHWPHLKIGGKLYLGAHSPAVVREGTWLALARGVSGMAYHALATVDRLAMRRNDARGDVEGIGYRGYTYSNPDSLLAVKQMSERVIQPYGMVIKRLTPTKGEVVMLLSTANSVLTGRDAEDLVMDEAGHMYAKLQAAHVPVDAAFEVDIEEKGLHGYKAIALPSCRVLPHHIYEIIRAFEDQGGLVIADQYLVPKFSNVLTLPRKAAQRRGEAALEAEHIDQARVVHTALDGRVNRWADCDSPTVILSVLEDGSDKYLFAINNLRRTGDYMKAWGRVLDDGVPQTAALTIPDAECVIYDVLERNVIQAEVQSDRLTWQTTLGPGEGKIFVVRPKAIAGLGIEVPESVKKGDDITIDVSVKDDDGPISKSLVPLHVTITDSQGTANDYSDYYLAQDGRASVTIPIAKNEPSGDWSVTARELYGGLKARVFFNVAAVESRVARPPSKQAFVPDLVQVPEMWQFRKDPHRVGEKENWFASGTPAGWQPISTHDFWDQVTGPHYEGDGWYAIDLIVPAVKEKHVILVFGGVDENYTLWINDKYISDNRAAGTTEWDKPVSVDITDHYIPGQINHFVVRVTNRVRAGGIYKPVRIIAIETDSPP